MGRQSGAPLPHTVTVTSSIDCESELSTTVLLSLQLRKAAEKATLQRLCFALAIVINIFLLCGFGVDTPTSTLVLPKDTDKRWAMVHCSARGVAAPC
jgi:hypothetical protein